MQEAPSTAPPTKICSLLAHVQSIHTMRIRRPNNLSDDVEEALASGNPRRRLRGLQRLHRADDPDLLDWCQRFSVNESGMDARRVISERANQGISCNSLYYKELQN